MNIALWKGVVDFFKIEIIHFMIDTSHKFAVNTTDIKDRIAVAKVTSGAKRVCGTDCSSDKIVIV